MKTVSKLLLSLSIATLPLLAIADPWKDESGHGKGHGYGHDQREYKEEYWDGNCKVERKLKKSGEYKEKRKCKPPPHGYYEQTPIYVPAPFPVVIQPGFTIQGTVRIPQ